MTRNADATPVLLGDIAQIRRGRAFRRGIPELDGEGEVVGGVIVLRSGKNALAAIQAIKSKLAALRSSLPAAVEIVPTYDRYPGGVLSVGALPFAQRPG